MSLIGWLGRGLISGAEHAAEREAARESVRGLEGSALRGLLAGSLLGGRGSVGIRVKGADELEKAFRQLRKEVLRELRPTLREAADPVRRQAQQLFEPIDPMSAAGYRVRVRMRGVAVEQSRKRTTGAHPQFGVLQMQTALLPALEMHQAEVIRRVDAMIDDASHNAGFF